MNNRKKYQAQIIEILKKYPELKKTKTFLFGSFLHKKKFFDVDLGISGNVNAQTLTELRAEFEQSNFPYKVDIIDFNKVDKEFKNYVFNQGISWLKF